MSDADAPAWPAKLALMLAGVVILASLGGLMLPVYAQETAAWGIEAIVQDWIDLLVLAPLLLVSAIGSLRGSRLADLVLGGGLMYATYTFTIYGFAVRFNRLFLVYVAALGLSFYALVGHVARVLARSPDRWFQPGSPVRLPAAWLAGLAAFFSIVWLSDILSALWAGRPPEAVTKAGLLTNPIHVLDLSVTLPAMILAGIWLWRRDPRGFALAPMLLVFALVTDVAIVAIILSSRAQGLGGELAVAAGIATAFVGTLAVLVFLLRGLQPASADP